jgi:hypothetical protein
MCWLSPPRVLLHTALFLLMLLDELGQVILFFRVMHGGEKAVEKART